MPCCQCCCGGVTCAEGQQGKCCCGGPGGTCCSESEYCCNGVCQGTPCCECTPGIRALDGSCRRFRYATVYDLDCCLLDPILAMQNGWENDGYFKIMFNDCSQTGVIVESTNWYAQSADYAVGQPFTADFGYSQNPTWKSLATNVNCCNPDGSKVYVELTDEITNPLP